MSLSDFEVLSKVGGSSSTVYKVRRIKDDGIYALKQVSLDNLPQR
jgi:hypothetical protein